MDGLYDSDHPDEDLLTAYTYDEIGNQKTVTDPLDRVTAYTYDELNRISVVTNSLSGTTATTYDPAGNRLTTTDAESRTTTYGYDELNRVVTTTNVLGDQSITHYDEAGRRAAAIDANGHTTTFEYDSLGRLLSTTDAESQTTTIQYNALGQRTAVTDAEGNTMTFTYDSLGRILTTTNSLSGTTSVIYDALGNQIQIVNPKSAIVNRQYDDLNRLTQSTDPNNQTTVTVYDGLGRRLSVTNAVNETTTFVYDNAGRLIQSVNPKSEIATYQYDARGNRVAMIDAEGVETRYSYDDLNRLASVIENYQDGVYDLAFTDQDIETAYTYDAVGNRLSVTDANTHTTAYVYDDLNRRIESRNPLTHLTRYGYDNIGNRTVLTDANGVVTYFDYDKVNRLTNIDYSDSTLDVTFDYNKVGQRVAMNDGTGVTTYTHDALYRLTGVNDGAGQQVGYAYDPAGNRTHLVYPDGRVVTYTYDLGNRLDTVTDWHGGQFDYAYDNANRMTGLSLPNSVSSSYDYDDAGRLTLLAHANLTETLASYAYSLDKVGNRRMLTETLTRPADTLSRTIVYTYDNLYRLTDAGYTTGQNYVYAYDPVGNRLQQIIDGDTTEYLYDAANRLATVDGVSYTFDDNGNLLATGVMTNTWDAANRLVEASRNGNLVQPIYNGVGDRIGQTVGVTTTHFALDVQGLPEVIYTSPSTGSGQVGNAFLHLPGVIVTESAEGEQRYLLSDGLGSVRQATDETATVVTYQVFDPYGNPVPSGNTGGEPYGYTGEWFESYIHLLFLRARWYAPETGTFLSRDPWEGNELWPQSMNGWNYVAQNPIKFVDPSGKLPACEGELPCKVIVGAKKIDDIDNELFMPWHHAFILVADPNRIWRPGIAPRPDIMSNAFTGKSPLETLPFEGEIPGHIGIDENVTVYYFRGGPDSGNDGSWIWGKLVTEYGYYQELKSDGSLVLDYLPETGRYETIKTDADCAFTLHCLKTMMDFIESMGLNYYPWARNSNTAVAFALRNCGLPVKLPSTAQDFWDTTPQFDEHITDDNWSGKDFE